MGIQNHRSAMVDMAKGVAIILVVYGHCLRGLIAAGIISSQSWLHATDYVIYTFHMPLFFIASGLFFSSSLKKTAWDFWTSRFKNLIYPYFFWSIFTGLLQIALSGSSSINGSMSLSRLMNIVWQPISPFWFLHALFFSNVIIRMLGTIRLYVLLLIFFVLFIALFSLNNALSDITYGLIYFTIGIFVRKQMWISRLPDKVLTTFLAFIIFIAVATLCYVFKVPDRMAPFAAILGVFSVSSACKTLERISSEGIIARLLCKLGEYSMSIFVMHIIVLGFVRTILLHYAGISNIAVIIITAVSAAIAIPVAAQYILIRIGINDWVGLPFSAKKIPIHRPPHILL